MANKFKDKFIKAFENKFKNFLVLDSFIKESIYSKLAIYIEDNNKLKPCNDIRMSLRL